MTKGSYPVVSRKGEYVGRQVYVEGKGWVYRPLPKPTAWTVLDEERQP